MYHIVYLTQNKVNLKIYVGKQSTYNLNDGYLGSGLNLKRAIEKYGVENFDRKILYFCLSEREAYDIEQQIVDIPFIKNPKTYNIIPGGRGSSGRKGYTIDQIFSEETAKNIRIKVSHPGSANGMFGKVHSSNTRKIISAKNKGRKLSNEHRRIISERMKTNNPFKGRTHSDETKAKLSELGKLRDMSAMCEAARLVNLGSKKSTEFCERSRSYRASGKTGLPFKYFKIIDSNNNVKIIKGKDLELFANDNNLSLSLLRRFVNKGPIFGRQSKQSEKVARVLGWQIIQYNSRDPHFIENNSDLLL